MEKKTIGGFIAALRKANGMTQKELAERLNVSDKTVSRWERDDGAPDLSLIPVIAEIFGVTCDELLRGERKSPTERFEAAEDTQTSPKGAKQRQRLLKAALSQFQNLTYISMGVSVVGMIAALICNLAFLKAVLGFLIGAIFFAGSLVCQAVFVNRAFLGVEDAEIEPAELSGYRRKVIQLAEKSVALTVGFLGFTFPLVLVDAYMGLGADSMLLWGAIGAAAFLLVYAVALYFLNAFLLKKGVYSLTEQETAIYRRNHKLKKKYAIRLAAVLAVTLLFHSFGSEVLWCPEKLESRYELIFNDYESFVEYMGQDNHEIDTQTQWFDEYGNVITEEEARGETLEDINGNVVCTYISRNESVSSIRYNQQDGTVLPIRVLTTWGYRAAYGDFQMINGAYCLLYPLELLAVVLVYFKKRAK